MLEDNDYSSISYQYLQQIILPGDSTPVITYQVKRMPHDWVGSELLEVHQVPYECMKSDEYGILECIGNWMRFTSKKEIKFDMNTLQKEYEHIQQWMKVPFRKPSRDMYPSPSRNVPVKHVSTNVKTEVTNILDPIHVRENFQQFLKKFGGSVSITQHQQNPYSLQQAQQPFAVCSGSYYNQ